jgi:LacI family transcriptional regulator, galactose operon repressor
MAQLVDEIIRLGHRHVGAVFGPRSTSTGESRETVLRSLLEEHDVYLRRQDVRHGPFDFDTGFRACLELLDLDDPPTVLVCSNDVVALGAMNAAVQRGVDIPGALSIVGFDDLPTSSWPLVQLTTVAYDLAGMSREAARLVVSLVHSAPTAYDHVVLPSHLVRRRTLGPPPRGATRV